MVAARYSYVARSEINVSWVQQGVSSPQSVAREIFEEDIGMRMSICMERSNRSKDENYYIQKRGIIDGESSPGD